MHINLVSRRRREIVYLRYVKVAYALHFWTLGLILPSLPNTAGGIDQKTDEQRYCYPTQSRTSRFEMHLRRAFRFRSRTRTNWLAKIALGLFSTVEATKGHVCTSVRRMDATHDYYYTNEEGVATITFLPLHSYSFVFNRQLVPCIYRILMTGADSETRTRRRMIVYSWRDVLAASRSFHSFCYLCILSSLKSTIKYNLQESFETFSLSNYDCKIYDRVVLRKVLRENSRREVVL